MNGLVALLTDYQGLAAACSHPLDPRRLLTLSWSVQVRQLADVVDLTGPHGPTSSGSLRLPRSLMTPKTVSAFRISRTLTSGSSDHLSPFAMWRAFPTSDYYGDSVTLGLAPVRPSHVPLVLNVSSVT